MYRSAYTEIVADSPGEMRVMEGLALGRSIELLEAAQRAGAQSREAIVALHYLRQLWSILIEDLANPENGLPPALRAQIISIGLSIGRGAEDIHMGRASDFAPLIDVTRSLREGLA